MNLKVRAIKSSKCSRKHKNPLGGRVCHPCSVMLCGWECGCQDAAKSFNHKIGRDVLLFKPCSLQLCRTFPASAFSCRDEKQQKQMEKAMYFFSACRIKEKYFKDCIPKKPGHLGKYLITASLCLLMLFSHPSLFSSETTDSASAAWLLFER